MIGVSCTGFSSRPVSDWMEPVSEHFRLWELFSEADHAVIRDPEGIRALFEGHGLVPQVHAPICDWNIGAMSDRLREASLQDTLDTIDAAIEIGARIVTIHPGLASMAVPGLEDRAVAFANESAKAISRHIDGTGIEVGMENMPGPPFFLGRTASDLGRVVDGTDLGITFDIGHANTTGQIDAMIDLFRDRIVNIHIHDNLGDRDAHMALGEGSIDFRHVIRRMSGYRGNWIIESKSLESAVQSLPRLEKMLSDSSGTQVSMD